MRKLLNTLYVTTPQSYLALEGETIVLKQEDGVKKQVPLYNLEAIVTFGYAGVSPALMGECVKRKIALSFMSANGDYLAGVSGTTNGNVLLRKEQYRISDDTERSLAIAKNILLGKLYNSRSVIERALRDHALRVDQKKLKQAANNIKANMTKLQKAQSLEEARGYEGNSAAEYFAVFDELILQQKEDFHFKGRNKRPALDYVNSLLSFAHDKRMNSSYLQYCIYYQNHVYKYTSI